MTMTVNTKAFNQDAQVGNDAMRYVGPANTFQVKDQILLSRTAPKPVGTFGGMARSREKLVRTLTLADGTKSDATLDAYYNIPVGAADADVTALLADFAALAATSYTTDLVKKLDINH